MSVGNNPRKPAMLVELSDTRQVPKNKTDDKQLRQAQIGPVTNPENPGLLEIIEEDGTVSVYTPSADVGSAFITLNQ